MPKKKQQLIKLNILYFLIFCTFLACFPWLKKNFGNNNSEINNGANVLNVVDQKTNSISSFFSQLTGYFYTKKYLQNKIQALESEVVDLKNAQEKFSTTQNIEPSNIVSAKKIFSDFTHLYETLVLDKGSSANIKVGDLVSVYENEVIGKVSEVSLNTSVVALFSKSNEKLEGLIAAEGELDTEDQFLPVENSSTSSTTSTSTLATTTKLGNGAKNQKSDTIIIDVYGYGGGDFTAKIPNSIIVATGTKVYLAQDESEALGEVVSIEKKDASFYQVLYIRGYYNPRQEATYFVKTK